METDIDVPSISISPVSVIVVAGAAVSSSSLPPQAARPSGSAKRSREPASILRFGVNTFTSILCSRFLTGHPLQWAAQNAAWGRVYRSLDGLVTDRIHWITQGGFYEYASTRTLDMLQAMAVIFVLVTVWPVLRRLGLAYAVMILVNVLPPLAMGGLLSMGRVTSVLFPTFLWLAAVLPRSHRAAWIAAFAMLQAVCAMLFFTWRPLY